MTQHGSAKIFEDTLAAASGRTRDDASTPIDTGNKVHQLQESLQQAYKKRKLEAIDEATPASACLKPLLMALDWTGMPRHLLEALPHLEPVQDINDMRSLLARLNFATTRRHFRLKDIGPGMLPCLFVSETDGNIQVLLQIGDDGRLLVFDGEARDFRLLKANRRKGPVYLIAPSCSDEKVETARNYGWINQIFSRFKPVFAKLLVQTFAINLLALAVPVYTMSVYDKAIGAKSASTLFYFLSGLLILLGVEMLLRSVRGKTVAFLGARFESVVTISAFQQLLHLPVTMTESSPISAQITRLRQFGNIRDLFVGQLGNAILDLPFALVFLAAIFAIGGTLGFLPLGLLVVFLLIAVLTMPLSRKRVRLAGDSKRAERDFLMEMTEKYKSIGDNGSEAIWVDRFKKLCSTHLLRQFRAQQFNTMLLTTSQFLVMVTGVLTVTLGTVQAINGDLTAGALIAVVALIWRLLSPIQAVFLGLNRLGETIDTFKQINGLMRLETERHPGHIPTFDRTVHGRVSILGVGFRYASHSEPALRGVSLDVEPGQCVAITGSSGAGKSTLLKLAAGLYLPQAGAVRVDGLDLRQIDTAQYRHAIAYVPESLEFYHGTVAQNLKLADPLISNEDMLQALRMAGIEDAISALPEGLDTRIKSTDRHTMPDGLRQQLSLARAYVKKSNLYLLDDPGARLDHTGDKAFIEQLQALKGSATILLVTHRPSHMKCADRIVVMNQGLVAADGSPDEILPSLYPPSKPAASA